MLELVDEEGLAEDIEQSDEFKEMIYAAVIRIEECRAWSLGPPSAGMPRPEDPAGPSPAPPVNKVKLPTFTIRPFNGELTAWTTFWDSYKAAIHDNPALSDIAKFNYLRSLLECTALDAIAGLMLTATNYWEAVSILEKRFGNKQQIVAKHMDALLNVEAVTSTSHLKSLRHLHDLVESHVRSLKSSGVPSGSYGRLLASVLVNKLPQELQLIVSWNLDAMMEVVEGEIQARERTAAVSTGQVKRLGGKEQPTAAALLAGTSSSGPTCSYCRQTHPSNACGVVTQPEARKRILQRSGRCFVCLRRGHISCECRLNGKCSRCSGRHHISICLRGRDTYTRQSGTHTTAQTRTDLSATVAAQTRALFRGQDLILRLQSTNPRTHGQRRSG